LSPTTASKAVPIEVLLVKEISMPAIRPLPHLSCLLIWMVAVLATPAQAAERTLDRTFKVEAGGRLDVAADAASIQVTGGSNNGVVVKVVLSGAQEVLDDVELSAAQQGNDVSVIAKRKTRNRGRLTGSITVQVPARYDIELKSSGGDLKVERVTGKTRGKTSGGDWIANQLQGNVEIQTSGGDITVNGVQGDLTAGTSGGSIVIDNVVGATRASSSGGDVAARRTRGATRLQSSGGDIVAEVTDGKVEAVTSGGDIRVSLSGSNQGISATTSGGGVALQLPSDVKATVDASISGGSVQSDLAVAASQKSRQRLVGTINGGGETIYARTSGGDVRISKR
jgi:DUF4097 and DUF4098 domain-containing protein YvlB